jgi:AraC-like DNA-binding protein
MYISEPRLSSDSSHASDLHFRIFSVREKMLDSNEWETQQKCDPFWRFYAQERDGFEIRWQHENSTQLLPMRGGSCYFVPARVPFSGYNAAPGHHFYIHFDIIGLPAFLLSRASGELLRPAEVPLAPEVRAALLEPLAKLCRSSSQTSDSEPVPPLLALRARALLSMAFASAIESGVVSLASPAGENEAIRPALEWIETHLHETLDNETLARRCHFCADYFIERFRRAMGTTPGQYVLERRLSAAAQQLLFSGETIESISAATGFCDRFHFSRAFKQRFDTSPAAYRKKHPA